MARQSKKVYGKETHYWRSEMKPLLVAAICVDVALEHSQEAKAMFQRIVDAWDKPNCQAFLKDHIALPWAEVQAWEKAVANKTDYVSSSDFFSGFIEKYGDCLDLSYLFSLIADFINVCFNRKGVQSISASSSPCLCLSVGIWTAGSYLEKRPDWDGDTVLKLGDKVLDASALEGVSKQRLHRALGKVFKRYGYKLNHDKKLRDIAWYWYQCRVVYAGPEEFCRKYLLDKGIELDPANISKEILLGDIATGYPRKNLPEQSLT